MVKCLLIYLAGKIYQVNLPTANISSRAFLRECPSLKINLKEWFFL